MGKYSIKRGDKMGKYYVELPVVLKFMTEVDADSIEDAIVKAMDSSVTIDVYEDKKDTDNLEFVDYEWEFHEHVVKGNVYYGGINEAYAELIGED